MANNYTIPWEQITLLIMMLGRAGSRHYKLATLLKRLRVDSATGNSFTEIPMLNSTLYSVNSKVIRILCFHRKRSD